MRADLLLEKMRTDWDRRARSNAHYYIANCREDWTEDEFFRSGEQTLAELILTDMINICQEKQPAEMRVLEIGCGAGRVTRALAKLFGDVHAVDVSGEMIKLARRALNDFPNAHVYHNNGCDLDLLGDLVFDFAFSTCLFHHIPSKAIIEHYIREVGKRLRPGCLFKFEVQGYLGMQSPEDDTWQGAPMSKDDMLGIAERSGFEPRYQVGEGEERYWLWFFRQRNC